VDKAVADCQAWLKTPKGQGKHLTKKRLHTFLRDAEPLSAEKPKGGGQAGTWLDSNKAHTPPKYAEPPIEHGTETLKHGQEAVDYLNDLRDKAGLGKQATYDYDKPEEEKLRELDRQAQLLHEKYKK
jgi:hypothetical protein